MIICPLRLNHNTARAILQGPADLGGGGFRPLQTTAGSGYVTHFLKFFRSPHEDVSKLVWTTLAWTQYQSGLSYGILQHPWTPISYVEGCYYKRLMEYLGHINGSINHSPSYVQPKLRSNDQAIMESPSNRTNSLRHSFTRSIACQDVPGLHLHQRAVLSQRSMPTFLHSISNLG